MIHPPPEAFVRATERHRAHVESREASSAAQILGWAAAGLLTLGLHLGLYLALTQETEPPPAPVELPAAVMIDMSPEPIVAKSEVDNASEGPPAADAQQAAPEPEEAPPPPPDPEPVVEAPPPPPEVKPQAVLPPKPPKQEVKKPEPKPPEKKVEKKKPEKLVQKKDKPTAASRSGGGPRSDQQTADRTAASSAGAAISQASRATWQNEMRAR
ncbi:MAG: energy transducer TonB, partial [Methylorubrum populi]